jgi:NAD-dependent DNA ligase
VKSVYDQIQEIIKRANLDDYGQELDDYGQPHPSVNRDRRLDRHVQELVGICKGQLADNLLSDEEIFSLTNWFILNSESIAKWPCNVIGLRLQKILEDGKVDEEEREELFSLLSDLTGRLPITKPAPDVIFKGRTFCFTGKTAYGARKKCAEEVESRGGTFYNYVSTRIHYLVLGVIGSRDWAHSTHGRKIEDAVALKIPIITEEHWVSYL